VHIVDLICGANVLFAPDVAQHGGSRKSTARSQPLQAGACVPSGTLGRDQCGGVSDISAA
jgi:hypothetical protein